MYDVEKRSAVLENAAGSRDETRIYMVPGVCLYIGETNFAFPKRCTSRNATSTEFLEVQIPPRILVYDWDP